LWGASQDGPRISQPSAPEEEADRIVSSNIEESALSDGKPANIKNNAERTPQVPAGIIASSPAENPNLLEVIRAGSKDDIRVHVT
jgi:hypothetical protein